MKPRRFFLCWRDKNPTVPQFPPHHRSTDHRPQEPSDGVLSLPGVKFSWSRWEQRSISSKQIMQNWSTLAGEYLNI
jgi:hypothetical protein